MPCYYVITIFITITQLFRLLQQGFTEIKTKVYLGQKPTYADANHAASDMTDGPEDYAMVLGDGRI